jgi:S1-C subfamily serine protease
MRKVLAAGAAVVALAVAAWVAPAVWAQGGRVIRPGIDPFLLQGPGSEIGVSVRELRNDEAATSRDGVFVQDVRADSPASRAGVRTGDVVVEFDGERVRSVRQFRRLVRETPPGRAVKATVVRGGARQTLDITPQASRQASMALPDIDISREIERGMRALPRNFDFDFDVDLPGAPGARRRLGVTLTPLGDQLAAYFGAKEGVLVSAVDADSPAAQAGVRAGDVITAVAGRVVRSPAEVTAALRDASAGTAVEIRLLREKKELTVTATIPDRRPERSRDRFPV